MSGRQLTATVRARFEVTWAHFACVSLNQWMALTPPELVRAHLNLDQQTVAALRKDKSFVVASQQQCRKRKPLPEWPEKTIAVLSTQTRRSTRSRSPLLYGSEIAKSC
jgi:hypothetical protein